MGNRFLRRPGFSLVEMLIVVAIIGLLLALTTAAAMKFIGTQQNNNTITGLKLYSGKAGTQWREVSDRAFRDQSVQATTWIASWHAANPGQMATTARAAYVQAMQVQAFPVTFNEAVNPNSVAYSANGVTYNPPAIGLSAWPAYYAPSPAIPGFLNGLGISGSSASTQPVEASVCLIMALTKGPFNDGTTSDNYGGANLATRTVNTGSTHVAVDGSGNPLSLARTANGLVITSAAGFVSTNLP